MHVFVTGATGFVGFHTVMALLSAGHRVRLGVRNEAKMRALYEPLGIGLTDFSVGEITDEEAIAAALEGVDAVVHTAAMVSLDASLEARMRYTNLRGTELVIGGAVARGIRSIVYVSSLASLFDPSAECLNEDSPLATARGGYAKSKAECDQYVRDLIAGGAHVALTYPAGVIGPDDPAMSEGNQAIAYFYNKTFMHTSSGMQMIDVRELARVHAGLLENNSRGFYLVSGHYMRYRELGQLFDQVTGKKLRKITMPRWLLRCVGNLVDFINRFYTLDTPITREAVTFATEWVYADDSKVRKELAIEYRPLGDTLRDTVRWMAGSGHIDRRWIERIAQN